MNDQRTSITMLAEAVAEGQRDAGPMLFGTVAARVRARLDPADADVVAGWFDRLASGEDPAEIFMTNRGGRPKGRTDQRKLMPDGREPDDWDIAFIVHQNMKRRLGMEPRPKATLIYKGVAKAFGMDDRTVSNIYSRCKKDLPDL